MISHCETFKHEVHLLLINPISILIILWLNKSSSRYEAIHSEHGKVIKCGFTQGSIERSIDLDKNGITSSGIIF
jgi:hypothetical protein